jgi:hypothetical protein
MSRVALATFEGREALDAAFPPSPFHVVEIRQLPLEVSTQLGGSDVVDLIAHGCHFATRRLHATVPLVTPLRRQFLLNRVPWAAPALSQINASLTND